MTGRSYSFAMAHGLSKKFGSALLRMGAKKGDVIGLVLPNIPEFPIGMLIQKSILELSFGPEINPPPQSKYIFTEKRNLILKKC